MSERKSVLKLNTKVHSGAGIIAFILGILSFVLVICAIIVSTTGNRDLVHIQYTIGVLEINAFLSALVGIFLGILAETTVETLKKFAHISVIINGLALVLHVIILVKGYSS